MNRAACNRLRSLLFLADANPQNNCSSSRFQLQCGRGISELVPRAASLDGGGEHPTRWAAFQSNTGDREGNDVGYCFGSERQTDSQTGRR